MRIVEPYNRLSYDVEDFITAQEVKMNLKTFEPLIDAKLQVLKFIIMEHFKPVLDVVERFKP